MFLGVVLGCFWGVFETIWEKLFFSWDFRGTFGIDNQYVGILFGNFVGITFENVGLSREKIFVYLDKILDLEGGGLALGVGINKINNILTKIIDVLFVKPKTFYIFVPMNY